MLKLLIVDDKYMVIEGLRSLVDWGNYGIRIVGEASNGQEGISLSESLKPDIIITDVKMPGTGGLDMIRKIKETNPGINFIVMSGYDDFNLAKKAFQYGAIDYILKPVDFEQLDAVLNKIIEKTEKDNKKEKEKEKWESTLSKSRMAMKNEVLTELLMGRYESVEAVQSKMQTAGITLGEDPYSVIVFRVKEKNDDTPEVKTFFNSLIKFVEEKKLGYGVETADNSAALIINAPGTNDQWIRIITEYLYMKFSIEGLDIKAGSGEIYQKLNKVKYSYIEAERALQYQYLLQKPFVHYLEIQEHITELERLDYPYSLENSLLECIKLADGKKASLLLDIYFESIKERKIEITLFKNIMMELMFAIKRELSSINVSLSKVFIDEYEEIHSVQEKENIAEAWRVVMQYVIKILGYMEKTAAKSNKQVVQEVMQYIEVNFTSPDISVGEIAEQVFLTPNYISSLVKQVTGENFIDIVVKKRMERAKELFFDVTLKTYEIAEKVGYSNPNYFSSIFKKTVGMTPAEFRNQFCS